MKPAPKPNIIDVWEHYGGTVQGGDSGGWRKGRCPIHEDGSASASVNEDLCRWRCFTCDLSGDALDLIREITGVTRFNDLVAIATDLFGGGDDTVPAASRQGGSLFGGSRGNKRSGTWVPPWAGL